MKMEGKFTAVFTNKHTGVVTKSTEKLNHIQDQVLLKWSGGGGTVTLPGGIAITEYDAGVQRRDWRDLALSDCRVGVGAVGLPVNEITYNAEPGIHLYRHAAQFDPPDEDYIIATAAIRSSTSDVIAAVRFDTPCTQTPEEILTVYYQIQVRFNVDWLTNTIPNDLNEYEARLVMDRITGGTGPLNYSSRCCEIATLDARKLKRGLSSVTGVSNSTIHRAGMYRPGHRTNFGITQSVGQLVHSLFTEETVFGYPIENIPGAPLQGVFGHTSASINPFHNAATVSTGTGKIAVNANGYSPGAFAEYVRISITATGAAGVSTYKYSVRSSVGFRDNTFEANLVHVPILSVTNNHLTGDRTLYTEQTNTYWPIAYDDYKIFMAEPDVLVLLDITKSDEAVILDNAYLFPGDINPRFLPTDIIQIEVDANKDFWVACGDTGLYFVKQDMSAMTVVDATTTGLTGVTGCYGICRGYSSRLWAYFDHTTNPDIYYSDDEGVSWTVTGSALHAGDPTVLRGIQADTSNADGHLLLIYLNGAYNEGTWWDNLNNVSSAAGKVKQISGIPGIVAKASQKMVHFQNVRCTPGGVWACISNTPTGHIMSFGTSTRTGVSNYFYGLSLHLTTDENGADAFLVADQHVANLLKTDGTVEAMASNYLDPDFVIPLKDGIWLSYYILANAFYFHSPTTVTDDWTGVPGLRSQQWTDYGWNGSAWVKDHAGSKPTHAAAEEIMTNVTIAFDDIAGNPDAFNDTDHYSFGLYDGVWLDGSTEFSFDHHMWYKPVKVETSTEESVLPAGTKDPNHLLETIPAVTADFTNIDNGYSTAAGNFETISKVTDTLEGRTLLPVIVGTVVPMVAIHPMPESGVPDVKGYVMGSVNDDYNGYVGLTDTLGGAYNNGSIPYAISFDTSFNGGTECRITALHNNIAQATIDVVVTESCQFRFTFTHQREMVYEIREPFSVWVELYRTTINEVILADYHLEIYADYRTSEVNSMAFYSMGVVAPDLYCYLGNAVDEGIFSTDFYAIDPDFSKIYLNGVEAVSVGDDDIATVLPANSYSVFPKAGIIRYSVNDIGKTITAEYTTITHS